MPLKIIVLPDLTWHNLPDDFTTEQLDAALIEHKVANKAPAFLVLEASQRQDMQYIQQQMDVIRCGYEAVVFDFSLQQYHYECSACRSCHMIHCSEVEYCDGMKPVLKGTVLVYSLAAHYLRDLWIKGGRQRQLFPAERKTKGETA